jgi:putative transposase
VITTPGLIKPGMELLIAGVVASAPGPAPATSQTPAPAAPVPALPQARIARVHARAANLRRDTLHKATTALAQRHQVIVVEDLNVTGMSRRKPGAGRGGRGLNRAIADAAPAELRRQLAYKSTWYSSRLVVAGRWYPSSKTCSACGVVKAKLALAERNWTCEGCGALHDRDVNAAINLARLGEHAVGVESRPAGSGPVAGRGAIQKTLFGGARGQETSTLQDQPVRKTGTAPPQGEAALP